VTQTQNKTHYHYPHFLQEEIKVLTAKHRFILLSFFESMFTETTMHYE